MLFCLKSNEQKTKLHVAECIIPWNTILRQMPYILFLLILCRFNTRRSRCLSLDNKAAFMRIAEFCSPALARSRYLNAVSTMISKHVLETIENCIRDKHVSSLIWDIFQIWLQLKKETSLVLVSFSSRSASVQSLQQVALTCWGSKKSLF